MCNNAHINYLQNINPFPHECVLLVVLPYCLCKSPIQLSYRTALYKNDIVLGKRHVWCTGFNEVLDVYKSTQYNAYVDMDGKQGDGNSYILPVSLHTEESDALVACIEIVNRKNGDTYFIMKRACMHTNPYNHFETVHTEITESIPDLQMDGKRYTDAYGDEVNEIYIGEEEEEVEQTVDVLTMVHELLSGSKGSQAMKRRLTRQQSTCSNSKKAKIGNVSITCDIMSNDISSSADASRVIVTEPLHVSNDSKEMGLSLIWTNSKHWRCVDTKFGECGPDVGFICEDAYIIPHALAHAAENWWMRTVKHLRVARVPEEFITSAMIEKKHMIRPYMYTENGNSNNHILNLCCMALFKWIKHHYTLESIKKDTYVMKNTNFGQIHVPAAYSVSLPLSQDALSMTTIGLCSVYARIRYGLHSANANKTYSTHLTEEEIYGLDQSALSKYISSRVKYVSMTGTNIAVTAIEAVQARLTRRVRNICLEYKNTLAVLCGAYSDKTKTVMDAIVTKTCFEFGKKMEQLISYDSYMAVLSYNRRVIILHPFLGSNFCLEGTRDMSVQFPDIAQWTSRYFNYTFTV